MKRSQRCQMNPNGWTFIKSVLPQPSIYMHIHLYASVYICIHPYTSICVYIHLYTSAYIYRHYKHLCTPIYICIHLYTFKYICIHLYTSIYIRIHVSKNLKDADFSCLKLIAATGVLKKSIRQCNYFGDPSQHEIIATAPKMSKAPGTHRMMADCWQSGPESTNVRTTSHILTYLDMSFRMFLY